jgi:hypothetical protein
VFTLSELNDWLQPNDAGADAALIQRIETVAVGLIEQAVDQVLSPARAVVHLLDGTGSQVLWLPDTPAATPALTLAYRSWGNVWTTFDSAGYELKGRQLIYLTGEFVDPGAFASVTSWTAGRLNWRASYTAGYADNAVPAALKQAVLDVVNFLYRAGRQSATVDKMAGSGWEQLPSVKTFVAQSKRPLV